MPDHRVAIVTGSSRGIGRGIAIELGTLGFSVAVNYVHNEVAARETASQIEQVGGRAFLCRANVADGADRARIIQQTIEQFGQIDLLVNNAGVPVAERADLLEASEESWDRVIGINLKGPYFLTQLAARAMIRRSSSPKRGTIINISSVSAYAASTNRGEYCVAKAGMTMMTQLFADRLAPEGIQVFEIRPGIISSDMTAPVRDKYNELIAHGLSPIRRWGEPADVAKAVRAIVLDLFPFSTGEIINVDGGFHVRRL